MRNTPVGLRGYLSRRKRQCSEQLVLNQCCFRWTRRRMQADLHYLDTYQHRN